MMGYLKNLRRRYIQRKPFLKHTEIVKNVKKDCFILDAGCGQGNLSKMLLEKGCHVVGCDIEKPNFKHKNFTYVKVDLDKKFPFKKRFDVIIFSDVLEHLKNPEKILHMAGKITKTIIVSIPNNHFILYKLFPKLENPSEEYSQHLHHWTLESFKKIIPTDFKITKIKYCSDFPELKWLNYLTQNKFFHQGIIIVLKNHAGFWHHKNA